MIPTNTDAIFRSTAVFASLPTVPVTTAAGAHSSLQPSMSATPIGQQRLLCCHSQRGLIAGSSTNRVPSAMTYGGEFTACIPGLAQPRCAILDTSASTSTSLLNSSQLGGVDGEEETKTSVQLVVSDSSAHGIFRVSLDPNGSFVLDGLMCGGTGRGFTDGHYSIAKFNTPGSLAWNVQSTILFVGDFGNCAIRAVLPSLQMVRTVAGMGYPGYADGPSSSVLLRQPTSMLASTCGLFFADGPNHAIRFMSLNQEDILDPENYDRIVVTSSRSNIRRSSFLRGEEEASSRSKVIGRPLTALRGEVATICGGTMKSGYSDGDVRTAILQFPSCIAFHTDGSLLFTDRGNDAIRRIADGRVETLISKLDYSTLTGMPQGLRQPTHIISLSRPRPVGPPKISPTNSPQKSKGSPKKSSTHRPSQLQAPQTATTILVASASTGTVSLIFEVPSTASSTSGAGEKHGINTTTGGGELSTALDSLRPSCVLDGDMFPPYEVEDRILRYSYMSVHKQQSAASAPSADDSRSGHTMMNASGIDPSSLNTSAVSLNVSGFQSPRLTTAATTPKAQLLQRSYVELRERQQKRLADEDRRKRSTSAGSAGGGEEKRVPSSRSSSSRPQSRERGATPISSRQPTTSQSPTRRSQTQESKTPADVLYIGSSKEGNNQRTAVSPSTSQYSRRHPSPSAGGSSRRKASSQRHHHDPTLAESQASSSAPTTGGGTVAMDAMAMKRQQAVLDELYHIYRCFSRPHDASDQVLATKNCNSNAARRGGRVGESPTRSSNKKKRSGSISRILRVDRRVHFSLDASGIIAGRSITPSQGQGASSAVGESVSLLSWWSFCILSGLFKSFQDAAAAGGSAAAAVAVFPPDHDPRNIMVKVYENGCVRKGYHTVIQMDFKKFRQCVLTTAVLSHSFIAAARQHGRSGQQEGEVDGNDDAAVATRAERMMKESNVVETYAAIAAAYRSSELSQNSGHHSLREVLDLLVVNEVALWRLYEAHVLGPDDPGYAAGVGDGGVGSSNNKMPFSKFQSLFHSLAVYPTLLTQLELKKCFTDACCMCLFEPLQTFSSAILGGLVDEQRVQRSSTRGRARSASSSHQATSERVGPVIPLDTVQACCKLQCMSFAAFIEGFVRVSLTAFSNAGEDDAHYNTPSRKLTALFEWMQKSIGQFPKKTQLRKLNFTVFEDVISSPPQQPRKQSRSPGKRLA